MNEPAKNPFDLLLEQFRSIVREEIAANGNGHEELQTAEELAKVLKVHKATVYEWVKTGAIPHYECGRFVRFKRREVLEALKKKEKPLDTL